MVSVTLTLPVVLQLKAQFTVTSLLFTPEYEEAPVMVHT